MNITEKLIYEHLSEDDKEKFLNDRRNIKEIDLKIDQTLTHDTTAAMAYNAFEALGLERIKTEVSVSYVDHNLLCVDNRTSDNHLYLRTIAQKYGLHYSSAGNGICHSVHMSRFAAPGKTILGADSHTATSGAVGCFAFGGGGVEVARAMAGLRIKIAMPEIIKVNLVGKLNPEVSTKDVALLLLKKYSVKGGVGKVFEYGGEGLKYLEVPQRATIGNMGAEMGATSSVFPSDEKTKEFFQAQERMDEFKFISADEDAIYDDEITIDLSKLKPMVAKPDQPDNVSEVCEVENLEVTNVFVGSCTNGSYSDIKRAALVMKDKKVAETVEFSVGVGSRQIFMDLMSEGIIADLVKSGARITELSCGACNGIGGAPTSGGTSVRTSNRNFKGRAGTPDAKVYLSSPETAAATAICGKLATADEVMEDINLLNSVEEPKNYYVDDSEIIKPLPIEMAREIEVFYGDTIKPMPLNTPISDKLNLKISLKAEDNITTDDITPNDANMAAMRTNIPKLSDLAFSRRYPDFVDRAKEYKQSMIIAGENYGQGSSREHAAITPMFLGVKIVMAKSLARIHKKNLINHGVLPVTFKNREDYEKINLSDEIVVEDIYDGIKKGEIRFLNKTKGFEFLGIVELMEDEILTVRAGGLLPYIKEILND